MDKLTDILKYAFIAISDNPAAGVPLAALFGAALALPLLALFTAVAERAGGRAHPGTRRRRNAGFWLGAALGLLSIGFFVIGAVLVVDFASYYYALVRWPAAQGTVAAARVECASGGEAACRAYVRYSYRYGQGEAEIRSGRLLPGGRPEAEALLRKYPAGSQVMVRYSPGNYRRSRLEGAGTVDVQIAALFLALAYVFAGILIFMSKRAAAAIGRMMPLNMPPLERR